MKTYKTGQRVLLPANKREGIKAEWAKVVNPPNASYCMVVQVKQTKADPCGIVEVVVSPKTGRILTDIISGPE